MVLVVSGLLGASRVLALALNKKEEFDVVSNSNRKEERGEAGRVREAWAVAPPSSLCSRKGRDPGWGCVVGQV